MGRFVGRFGCVLVRVRRRRVSGVREEGEMVVAVVVEGLLGLEDFANRWRALVLSFDSIKSSLVSWSHYASLRPPPTTYWGAWDNGDKRTSRGLGRDGY